MSKLEKYYKKTMRFIIDKAMGNGLMQEENTASGARYITPGMPSLARECGREGIVLLENDGVLPLASDTRISIFGRCQHDWFYVGYGSGGDVHPPYQISLFEGLKNQNIPVNEELKAVYDTWCESEDHKADHGWWGHWPYFHPEMPLKDSLVQKAAKNGDTAIVVIGRAAGEDRENVLEPGSYYLTDLEKDMLNKVTEHFKKVILIINSGSIMDLSFTKDYHFSAIVYAWQLGQESGNALAEILKGTASPSGKLTDTIAEKYEDYPSAENFGNKAYNNYAEDIFVGYRYFETFAKDKVLYPFGYGLSYTTFAMEPLSFVEKQDRIEIGVKVTNTGNYSGKEVVQIYCEQPEGTLAKASRVLAAFGKTECLEPGASEELTLTIDKKQITSFDDKGETGFAFAFVLEKGSYRFFLGNSVRAEAFCGAMEVPETLLWEQCESVCAADPAHLFQVKKNQGHGYVYASDRDLKKRILDRMPEELKRSEKTNYRFTDVKEGKCTLEEFVAQLSDRELSDLTHGEGSMGSALGTEGNAGVFGGITKELRDKGIPVIVTADGPAGLRIRRYTTLLPCGAAIACTWNTRLVEELFTKEGEETAHFGIDVILSPGMNIHRNPLCGRNFEYYSEDPMVSGSIAAAAVRGIQAGGVSACPKHFACNNQETNRNHNDSRVSERALREIYLRNFEICVKEGQPQNLMTSYNKVNGVWSHYNYDLATTVLRNEWGYDGNIVTDWWMRKSKSPEFPMISDNAYRVRAQVDVLMPGNMSYVKKGYHFDEKQLSTLGKPGGITRAELQRSAKNVLRFALTRM